MSGRSEHWRGFLRQTPLGVLADLDGTLLSFADTPDASAPDPALIEQLNEVASLPGVTLAVVSGRGRESLEGLLAGVRAVLLVAEHGGWRRDSGEWRSTLPVDAAPIQPLAAALEQLAARYPGALVERKTWSVVLHFRLVAAYRKDALLVQAGALVKSWLDLNRDFERLEGAEMLEVRPLGLRKASAVDWVRERAGQGAHLLALGDDVTDEGMFRALGSGDEAVLVGEEGTRPTSAKWWVASPVQARGLLHALVRVRREQAGEDLWPTRIGGLRDPERARSYQLLVVSNRLPELRAAADSPQARKRNVGGLVSALRPVVAERHGIWLGWSGRVIPEAEPSQPGLDTASSPALAWVDFPETWHHNYYNGFCNRALWPLLHSFPERVQLCDQDWETYRQVNEAFAEVAMQLVGLEDPVWIHDYHLFLLGERLRLRGHQGPLGLFLHVPFPSPDMFFLLPWSGALLEGLLALDLVGFHTPEYVENFRSCAARLPGVRLREAGVERHGHLTLARDFPIGMVPQILEGPSEAALSDEVEGLIRGLGESRLVLGVDRLDYTKGIPQRLEAFGRLLELHPEWRRKVSLVQISVPSRADVPEYSEQRSRVEQAVGRINGEFGDADWVPIRYLYRSYRSPQLGQLYRAADVGYVTPLRDGMNLVAKEYVAAQDPARPGVLLLSRFAGAATELRDALLTNPWHVDGMARDLHRALVMPAEERLARHRRLRAVVESSTAVTWAEEFLSYLASRSVLAVRR